MLHYATHNIRLTHGHRKLRLTPDLETLPLRVISKTLHLTPARRQPDAMFRNQASGARFQNHASDIIFCDHASDVQYESSYVPSAFEVHALNE